MLGVTVLVFLFLSSGLGGSGVSAGSTQGPNWKRAKQNGIPKYYYEPDTTKYCMWWLDNTDGDWTCQRIEEELEISMIDFHEWSAVSDTGKEWDGGYGDGHGD
ncbi:hypothetical protein B0T16DRAFT_395534 [Cercophora newfieldiana]|uniref:Uncharacterized protein n=1 Tax=Cercophora newfieldiana TaxID=92897 RepID=A0AA40CIB5_9PEZI|nr:hypothetical protein B0T16DRAFT_395534 [Cercophora newfieldiana]